MRSFGMALLQVVFALCGSAAVAAPITSLRNLRYWAPDRLPIRYETDAAGDPRILDGSEYTAIDQAFRAWTQIPGVQVSAMAVAGHGGLAQAASGDGRNSITFSDPDGFVPGFLGLAVVTSVTGDTTIAGRLFHAGEIVDADILFNAADFSFSTPSFSVAARAYDLRSLAAHEVGHVLGLAHSCIGSATMFWALPHGTAFSSLEEDDRGLALRNYGNPAAAITGRILRSNGVTPLPGAAVLAIGASGDTLQMTVSNQDGHYDFYGLTSSCRVYVLPIDGGPEVGGLVAAAVNDSVAAIARVDFVPEFYDGVSETNIDFGTAGVLIARSSYPVTDANIVLNDDITPPQVVATDPAPNATNVPITAAVGVKFDDRIASASVNAGTVTLRGIGAATGVDGGAALLQRDSLLVFTPSDPLRPAVTYELTVGPGIQDRFGNTSTAVFTTRFTTEPARPLSISALSPAEIPVGATLTIRGTGFDLQAANNQVYFGARAVPAAAATVERLFVTVPDGAQSPVHVEVAGSRSNDLSIQIVEPRVPPLASRIDGVFLAGDARGIQVDPGGNFAYVATDRGMEVVVAKPGPQFLEHITVPVGGGCTSLVVTSDGTRVVTIGPEQPRLRVFAAGPGTGNRPVDEATLVEEPLGITMVPGDGKALIAFASRVVLFDIGVQFGLELRQWADPTCPFQGGVAAAYDGRQAYAAYADGRLAVLDLAITDRIVNRIPGGTLPSGVAALPGGGVLTVDGAGEVRRAAGPVLSVLPVGGGYSGVAVSPEGGFAYAANFTSNRIDVVDLQRPELLQAASFECGIDPRGVATGAAGRYVYVVSRTGGLEVFDANSTLEITSVMPQSGGTGTLITIRGNGFSPVATDNIVNIGGQTQVTLEASPDGTTLLVRQTAAAIRGELRVLNGTKSSNTVIYNVENRPDAGSFTPVTSISEPSQATLLAMSPNGNLLFATHVDGELSVTRADPEAPDLHRKVQRLSPADAHLNSPREIAATPDGKHLYIADLVTGVQKYSIDESRPDVLHWTGRLPLPGAASVTVSPDGRDVYVAVTAVDSVLKYSTEDDALLGRAEFLRPQQVAVHPSGGTLYVGGSNHGFDRIDVFGLHGSRSGSLDLPTTDIFIAFAIRPDGRRMYVLTLRALSTGVVFEVDTEPGHAPAFLGEATFGITNPINDLIVNHSGTRLFVRREGMGFVAVELEPFGAIVQVASGAQSGGLHASVISQDDARLYGVQSPPGGPDELEILSLTPARTVGVEPPAIRDVAAGAPLPEPFVVHLGGGPPDLLRGTPVRFECAGGNFGFPDGVLHTVADGAGKARAFFTAGPTPGFFPIHVVTGGGTPPDDSAGVIIGGDPTLAPIRIVAVRPTEADTASIITNMAVDFSRALAPGTMTSSSIFVRPALGGPPVEARLALTDLGRRVVIDPVASLSPTTAYEIVVTDAIRDLDGNPLFNPRAFTLVTGGLLPLKLNAVQPPAARPGDPLRLSGSGFGASTQDNTVFFGDLAVTPAAADAGALTVIVPPGAVSGAVHVQVAGAASNSLPFVVLGDGTPLTNRVATVSVPSGGQRIAVVPDGSRAYMTSPASGSVVPIRIADHTVEPAVPVGAYPFDIASAPDGSELYVTNFHSNDVSVIGARASDPSTFQQVIATIPVGRNPAGIAVSGTRVYVTNYGDATFTIFTVDPHDALRLTPIGGGSTITPSQAVAVTPDGRRVIFGTATGIAIVDAISGGALAGGASGQTTTTVHVTPDGGFAVALTATGQIWVFDIRPGSPTENEGALAGGGSGQTTTTVHVSPDGGFLYVTYADGTVNVFTISFGQGVGKAVARPAAAAIVNEFRLVASFTAGENLAAMAFSPLGDLALLVDAGAKTVIFFGAEPPVPAQVEFDPGVFNVLSRGGSVTAKIRLDPPFDPADIDASTVSIQNAVHPTADLGTTGTGPHRERKLKFDRASLLALLPSRGTIATLTMTGQAGVQRFAAQAVVRVLRPDVLSPHSGDVFTAGQTIAIRWTPVPGAHHVGIYVASEDGSTVRQVADRTPDDGVFDWTADTPGWRSFKLTIVAWDARDQALGIGASDGAFIIRQPTGTGGDAPLQFGLGHAMPNPFAGGTSLLLELPREARITFEIYAANGTLVRRISRHQQFPAGRHVLRWDGRNEGGAYAGAGVYFAVLHAGPWTAREKIVRMR